MKKSILSFIVACLSLTSSLITIQAAAQNNLTEGQVRNIVTSMTHHDSSSSPAASPTSSLYGPRFEVIPMPNNISTWFKFDKETGDTWVVENKPRGTTSRQIRKDMISWNDDKTRPGQKTHGYTHAAEASFSSTQFPLPPAIFQGTVSEGVTKRVTARGILTQAPCQFRLYKCLILKRFLSP